MQVLPLTIGIDGYNLAMPRGTGIATYGLNLVRTIQSGGHDAVGVFGLDTGRDASLRETLFFDRVGQQQTGRMVFGGRWHRRLNMAWATVNWQLRPKADPVPLTDRVDKDAFADRLPDFRRLVSVRGLFPIAQRHFGVTGRFLPIRMDNPPDIMHWTYPVPIRMEGTHNIYTIHDLVPLRLPYTTLTDKLHFSRLLRRCVEQADHICTVSDYSRDDIADQCGISPDIITNTYQNNILPSEIEGESFEASAKQVSGIFNLKPRGYFLFFGALEPKKNVGRLLEAYLGLGLKTPLVLVGARAWLSEGELALLPADDPRIIRLDYLGRSTLLRLIRAARAVLFPSIFEGFGLPVLEAMQLGTPVLTSDRSSLPEVAGNAAILVDPYSIASIAEGIARLDSDNALRDHLVRAGPIRAAHFSQQAYLGRLESMYQAVLAKPPKSG